MNLNKVFILGNLTADPELRQTAAGQSVCSFSIATNRFYTDKAGQKQKQAEFHNIVAWGRQAEIIGQFLKKGAIALIEGRLQTRTWQDKQGQNRKTTEIICEQVQLGPRNTGTAGAQFTPAASRPVAQTEESEEIKETLPEINIDEEEIKVENIPF